MEDAKAFDDVVALIGTRIGNDALTATSGSAAIQVQGVTIGILQTDQPVSGVLFVARLTDVVPDKDILDAMLQLAFATWMGQGISIALDETNHAQAFVNIPMTLTVDEDAVWTTFESFVSIAIGLAQRISERDFSGIADESSQANSSDFRPDMHSIRL